MSADRYAVTPDGAWGGYLLRDLVAGSEALVLPAIGANCVRFRIPGPQGQPFDILRPPATAAALKAAPARAGLPLLFPYPNRIRDGRYEFAGQSYQLPTNHQGNAIHGLVLDQPFQVEAAEATETGARLRCGIAQAELPAREGYPFPFRFTAEYLLRGVELELTVQAINTGPAALPFGFGIHPYFRAPVAVGGSRDDCLVSVPVGERWELDGQLIPTGNRVPVSGDDPLPRLAPLDGRTYDDVYRFAPGQRVCRLVDPSARLQIELEADDNFGEVVVYAPPGLDAVCFEPYTCTTDAFNLEERLVQAGRLVLPPGQTWSAHLRLSVRST